MLEAEASLKQTEHLLRGIKIPPQPRLLLEVHEEKFKEEPDLARVAKLIGHDVVLAASVLKVANSPFFHLAKPVRSIQHGVALLGLDATFNIITALMLKQSFDDFGGDVAAGPLPLNPGPRLVR